jgi:hypothetical protein
MKDRRRAWLNHLVETRFKGDRAALIKETGLTKGRVSQLFDPDQAFGERASLELARRISGLEETYFENPVWPSESNPLEDRLTEMTASLRQIHALDPTRFNSLHENVNALLKSLETTYQLLRDTHGVTGYVTPERAEETLGQAPKAKTPTATAQRQKTRRAVG